MRLVICSAAAFLVTCGTLAAQAPPTATQVTPKVTATTVSAPVAQGAGTLTTVRTATTSGNNAYNYFSTFNVAAPDTVDLLLPGGTVNLVNLVDNQALIWGRVNSIVSSGQIGGNVFFADPQGLVLGAGGIINAGSLAIVTPSPDFMNGFFDANGNPTAESAALTGAPAGVPLSPGGLISIAGAVSTNGPVTLVAPVVNVSGSVNAGQSFFQTGGDPNFDPNLGSFVNTTGLISGETITVDGNSITIDGGASRASLNSVAGDIDLNANQVVNLQWIPGLTFFQAPSASAGITLGNAGLSGQNIDLEAVASTTKLANPPAGSINDQSDGGDFLQNVGYSTTPGDTSLTPLFDNPAFQGLTELAGVAISKANANISMGETATTVLNAAHNLTINASATSNVEVQTIGLYTGIAYGESDATASAVVGAHTVVNAFGDLSLEAETNNSLLLTASTASGVQGTATSKPEPAVALAYGKADSETTAGVDAGASLNAGTISVEADNANSFESEASGSEFNAATGKSGAGIGIALGFFTSNANAYVNGYASTFTGGAPIQTVGGATVNPGDIYIGANSINSTNSVEASSSVSDDMNNAGIFSQLPFTQNIAQFASSQNPNAEANANKLNLSGAVSYADTSNNATASLGAGGVASAGISYFDEPGNVTINALAQDAPDIAASGSAGGGQAAIGGSLAWSDFGNTANALLAGQATAATGVSVLASAEIPNRLNAGPFTALPGQFDNLAFSAPTSASGFESDWSAVGTLVGDLETALNPNGSDLGEFLNDNGGLNNILTSFVNTGASANGGDQGAGYGVAGSLNFLHINNQAAAVVNGAVNAVGAVTVAGDAEANLINWAGTGAAIGPLKEHNIGVTGDGSIGGAYDGVNLNNGAEAEVEDGANVSGSSVSVTSNTAEFLVNLVQAGNDSEKFGVTGTFDWVTANDSSLAFIQSNAVVTTPGALTINAANSLDDFTIGGALGFGGSTQVGATVAWNQITNTTEAYIGDPGNQRTQATGSVKAGSLNLNADANEALWAISVAADKASGASESNESGTGANDTTEGSEGDSFEGTDANNNEEEAKYGFGASGNVIINDLTDTTESFINNGAQVGVGGAAALSATDNAFALAGGLAASLVTGGKDNALAGAFSRNDLSKTTVATLANATLAGEFGPEAGSLALNASNSSNVFTVAAGGAIAGSGNSLAGAVANNPITNTTQAGLGADASVTTWGDLDINATTNDKVISVAGAVSGGGGNALGAALDYSQYGNTTQALLGDGDNVSVGGNMAVSAYTIENLMPIAASLAVGGSNSLSGSAAQEGVDNLTQADIGDATVLAEGNLLLASGDGTTLHQIVGSAAVAGGNAIGLSGAISTAGAPLLERETDAEIASGASVTAWGNDADPIAFAGINVVGMELASSNSGSVDSFVAGGALAGDVSVAAELILNYINDNANTLIGANATINANDGSDAAGDQQVGLAATDTTGFLGITGALSGAGTAAIGAAADTEFLTRNVNAVIGAGTNVAAAGNVTTVATLQGGLASYAVAGGFAGSFAADGAASILSLTDTTRAEIDGNATAGGSVGVAANRNTSVAANEGGLSLSLGGALAAALAKVTTNETVIGAIGANAQVTGLGDNSVSASIGGANPQTFTGVSVTAVASGTLTDYSVGGAIGGIVGADGSGILNNLSDTTTAEVGAGAALNAPAVNVLASDGTGLTDAAGAAAAGAVGIGAAGDGLPSTPNTLTKNTTAELSGSVVAPNGLAVQAISSESLTSYSGAAAAGIAGLAGAMANYTIDPTTQALINNCGSCSAPALTVGSLTLAASDNVNSNLLAGGFAIGAVGFGGALIEATLDANTAATLGSGVTVETPGAVTINATLNDKLAGKAYAAAGGVIGVSGADSELNDNSVTSATIGSDASIQGASSVAMNINSRRELDPTSLGAAIGVVAGGLSIDDAEYRGGTEVTIGTGAQIGEATAPVGSFTLSLFDLTNANPNATALSGGVVSGVGAETEGFTFTRSETDIDSQAAIYAQGDIDLGVANNVLLNATVSTEQIGALNAGSAFSEGELDPSLLLNLGAAKLETGGKLTLTAAGFVEADASADSAASSSFVSDNYTEADASVFPDSEIIIGSGAVLTAANQVLVEVSGNNNSGATANGQAGSFNVAAQGSTTANSTNEGSTTLVVDGAVTSTGNSITLEAFGGGSADANTTGGSGGGIYTGATTSSNSQVEPTITAELESGAHITALDGAINFLASGGVSTFTETDESGDSSIIPTSLVSLLEGDANLTAIADINAEVVGATLDAETVNLTAQANEFVLTASSFVQTGGDGNARALAQIDATLRPELSLSNANITGTQAVNLLATSSTSNGAVVTRTSTEATNSACDFCAGELHSDSYDNFTDLAILNGGPASSTGLPVNPFSGLPTVTSFGHITTPSLTAQVLMPINYSDGVSVWGYEFTNADGSDFTDQDESGPSGDDGGFGFDFGLRWLTLQGTVQGAPAAPVSLLVAANGSYSGNLPVIASDASDLVLGAVTGGSVGSLPALHLTESAGPGTVADSIGSQDFGGWFNDLNSSALQSVQGAGATVTITNNSPLNIIVGAISAQDINMNGDSTGDMLLNGLLNAPQGAVAITDQGGSILSTGAGQIVANQITLDAVAGAIGTGGSLACPACGGSLTLAPLSTTLFENGGATPTGAFTAGGALDVNTALFEDASAQPAAGAEMSGNISALSAGGNLALGIGPGLEAFGGTEYEVTSDINFLNGATAGGTMAMDATGFFGGEVQLELDGTVQSAGDMSLFATRIPQAANLVVTNPGSNISVGAFAGDLNLTVQTAGGSVSAFDDFGGAVNIVQPSGDLNVDQISSASFLEGASGPISLTAENGSIDDAENGTVTNVFGGSLNLNAPNGAVGGGSFSDAPASPLRVQITGPLTATTLFDVNLTQVVGSLTINQITNQTFGTAVDVTALAGSITGGNIFVLGDVSLNAPEGAISISELATYIGHFNAAALDSIALSSPGNLPVGNISSQSGDVTLDASGLIVGGGTISGRNITLAAGGDIGGSEFITTNGPAYTPALSSPVAMNATGVVSATGPGNINLDQANGNLTLANVSAGGEALVTAGGAILDGAPSGAAAVTASEVVLNAASLGAGGSPLPVAATYQFDASATGDINVLSTGTLLIGDVASSAGAVNLTSTGGSLLSFQGVAGEPAGLPFTGSGTVAAATGVDLLAPNGGIGDTSIFELAVAPGGVINANAQGGIDLTAEGGNLPLGTLTSGGEINLVANGGSILAATSGLNLKAAIINLFASNALGSVANKLTGTAGSWNATTGSGMFLVSDGTMDANTLNAANVQVTVNNGNASINDLISSSANLALTQAGASLTVNNALINGLLRASADNITLASVVNTSTANPLYLSLVGANSKMAQNITATVASAAPVIAETWSSQNGSITDNGDWLMVEHAGIGKSATFANNWESVALTNPGATVQYFTGDFVGSELAMAVASLQAATTARQPTQTYTLPATLTSFEQWMVNELALLP